MERKKGHGVFGVLLSLREHDSHFNLQDIHYDEWVQGQTASGWEIW